MTQLDLPNSIAAVLPGPLIGLAVELSDACRCGGIVALIGAGSGPHCASLHCASCDAHRGWLAREAHDFTSRIIGKFGPLTAPIAIRRSKGASNHSGSDPEYAPAAQSGIKPTEVIMRKHEIFPSNYYNSKAVSTVPVSLTIDYAAMELVGEGANKQEKLVAHFKEPNAKLLVVTSTKFDAISLIAQSDDTDDWQGVKIVLEAAKVPFQGSLVDSIGIRAPRKTAPRKPVAPPVEEAEFDDEI
jgi:hypothetical protein